MISKLLLTIIVTTISSTRADTLSLKRCWTPIGCDHGEFKNPTDRAQRICTCDNDNWGANCCDDFVGQCQQGMTELCPTSELELLDFPIADMLDSNGTYAGPITLATADHGIPTNMQGVFWLQDQSMKSSLMSFGPSRDGKGISEWQDDGSAFRIRVAGDRTWSTAGKSILLYLALFLDYTYEFRSNSATDPTEFDIIIIPMALSFIPELLIAVFNSLFSFKMSFISLEDEKHEYPAANGRPAAVQWDRRNKVLGFDMGFSNYQVAQVFDGEGTPTAAYDSWMAYNAPTAGIEGWKWKDGKIYFHSA